MDELKRIEKLVAIHRRKKRKKMLMIGIPTGIAAVGLLIFGGVMLSHSLKNRPVSSTASRETEAQTETSTETETLYAAPISITVSLTGDCTLGTDESFYYPTSFNAFYDVNGPSYFFQNVASVFEADDLTIVNLEGTLTTSTAREDKLYAFKGDPSYVDILTNGSVEAANLANNHSHDYGDASYTDTVSALTSAGITPFGYDETAVLDIKGVKVGLVGIYELADHLERETQLITNIEKVKEEGAQIVIVIFHWGNEKDTVPDSNQITLAKSAIDHGADLVAGHHAHVLQGVKEYQGKTIAFGLGNFCFGGNSSPSDMDTMIFQQTFTVGTDGTVTIEEPNLIPCRISSDPYTNNYQPTPAEGEEGERILQKIQDRSDEITL